MRDELLDFAQRVARHDAVAARVRHAQRRQVQPFVGRAENRLPVVQPAIARWRYRVGEAGPKSPGLTGTQQIEHGRHRGLWQPTHRPVQLRAAREVGRPGSVHHHPVVAPALGLEHHPAPACASAPVRVAIEFVLRQVKHAHLPIHRQHRVERAPLRVDDDRRVGFRMKLKPLRRPANRSAMIWLPRLTGRVPSAGDLVIHCAGRDGDEGRDKRRGGKGRAGCIWWSQFTEQILQLVLPLHAGERPNLHRRWQTLDAAPDAVGDRHRVEAHVLRSHIAQRERGGIGSGDPHAVEVPLIGQARASGLHAQRHVLPKAHRLAAWRCRDHRQRLVRRLQFPAQDERALPADEPVNRNRILETFSRIEPQPAGEKPATVLVLGDGGQQRDIRPRVNPEQRVERAADGAEGGDAVARRHPPIPHRVRSELARVIGLADFARGPAIGAADGVRRARDQHPIRKVVSGRLLRHLDDDEDGGTGGDAHVIGDHHGVTAAVGDLRVGERVGRVRCSRNVLAVLAPLIPQRRRARGIDRQSDLRTDRHQRALRQRCQTRTQQHRQAGHPACDRAERIAHDDMIVP